MRTYREPAGRGRPRDPTPGPDPTGPPNAVDPLAEYDFELPSERIAQEPTGDRDASRLLVVDRSAGIGEYRLSAFEAIGTHLRRDDVLVVNDARVFAARLRFARPGGASGEVLFLEPAGRSFHDISPGEVTDWEALVRPARWARRHAGEGPGIPVDAGAQTGELRIRILGDLGDGRFRVRPTVGARPLEARRLVEVCNRQGEVPLPPYIQRPEGVPAVDSPDRERYQTVYARQDCAVAAPTAGLHFTEALLERLRSQGIDILSLTHQVGIGTFLPLRGDALTTGKLHAEWTRVPRDVADRLRKARASGRRIVAVGTTTVRALESFAAAGMPERYHARTELFIRPGHRFRLVDAMLTNFHLPRSSLIVLVSAFAGRERILEAYRYAIERELRFYSYGDAMLIL